MIRQKIKKAIILAAGLGSRLKPLTDESPKCLTEVKGIPILLHDLELLEKCGMEEAVIVIGYLGEKIKDKIGASFDNMDIKYVWNKDYFCTNSMYSLWLAREYLKQGSLVIEGDCIYESKVIESLLRKPDNQSFWAVDRFVEGSEGCMLISHEGKIIEINIIREKLCEYKKNYHKSAGLLKINKDDGVLISNFLDEEVKNNNVKIYYDLVLAKNIDKIDIFVMDIAGAKWSEIDTKEDLRIAEGIFEENKYIIVICDGSADLAVKTLGNRTPYEAAKIPRLHDITRKGMTTMVQTSFKGLPVGSIVACLGLLGYDPYRYYPNGRASFEAIARGIFLDDNDICFRCNLISTKNGKISDFTAGMISDKDAMHIIDNLDFANADVELYPGQSYRNILVLRNAICSAKEIKAFEPHMNIDRRIEEIMLNPLSKRAVKEVAMLNELIMQSIGKIKKVNSKYKTKADMIWLWSPSSEGKLPSFYSKHNLRGAIVGGLDFIKGIGEAANMFIKEIPGATGYIDTNLREKLQYTKNFLRNNDFILTHINMPDEASHMKDPVLKVRCLERIHDDFLAPLLEFLENRFRDKFRIAFLPDHYTLLKDGTHQPMDVPAVVYGAGVKPDSVVKFTEKEIGRKTINHIKSYELLDLFMR